MGLAPVPRPGPENEAEEAMMFPSNHRRRARHGASEHGAAAVEFALVVPILLLLVVGNYSFVFAQQISLNNGARQAARHAVVE